MQNVAEELALLILATKGKICEGTECSMKEVSMRAPRLPSPRMQLLMHPHAPPFAMTAVAAATTFLVANYYVAGQVKCGVIS